MKRLTGLRGMLVGAVLTMGLMAPLLLTGCGGGGGNDDLESLLEESLPGSWRVSRIAVAGQSTACAGEINYLENGEEVTISCGANDSVAFNSDGSFTGFNADGGAYGGRWQARGNDTLVITITTPESSAKTVTEHVEFAEDGTFTTEVDGAVATFTKQ